MQPVGDKTQFYDPGLEEVDESPVFCECGYSKKIPAEVDFRRHCWQACDAKDLVCDKCGDFMEF